MVEKKTLDFRLSIVAAGGCAIVLSVFAAMFIPVQRGQWDLKVYLQCSHTLASGADPYATQPIVGGDPYQCLYPPLATDLYRPFSAMSRMLGPSAGERAWAALKAFAFVFMLFAWRRWVLKPGADVKRALFIVFAYGNPFLMDFMSGNAGSLEHAILWGALAAFIGGRDVLFVVLIAFAAQLKLLPLAFLVLALSAPRPKWKIFFGGAALSLLLFSLNEVVHPGLLRGFWSQLADPAQPWRYERGPNNCAAFGLFQHVFETWSGIRPQAAAMALWVYVPWAAVIAGFTAWTIRRAIVGGRAEIDKRRQIVFLFITAYALLVPRLKDYSFLLLIPPTLAALESDAPLALRGGILLLALLNSTKALAVKLGLGPWALFAGYFKLYAVVLVWIVLLIKLPKKFAATHGSE